MTRCNWAIASISVAPGAIWSRYQRLKFWFQTRLQLDGFFEIFLSVFAVALAQLDHATVAVDPCVFWIELDGFIVVFQSLIIFADKRESVGAVVVDFRVFGIEFNGFRIVLYGLLVFAEAAIGQAPAVIHLGIFRIEFLRLIEVRDRFVELA